MEGTIERMVGSFFYGQCVIQSLFLGSWEPIFKPTYAESKLFGQIDCQAGFSSVVEFGSLAQARDLAVSI